MDNKLSIIAYKGGGHWYLSVETSQGGCRYVHPLNYLVKTKKQVTAFVSIHYPNHELEFEN